jgi:hypothetical protein
MRKAAEPLGLSDEFRQQLDRDETIVRKFIDEHQAERGYVSFKAIVKWLARDPGPSAFAKIATLREKAWQLFRDELERGAFDIDGRSEVLFLNPRINQTPLVRLSRTEAKRLIELHGRDTRRIERKDPYGRQPSKYINADLVRAVLWHCWIPREVCRQWLSARGMSEPAGGFEHDPVDDADEDTTSTEALPIRDDNSVADHPTNLAPLPDKLPPSRKAKAKAEAVLRIIRARWPHGPPSTISVQKITSFVNKQLKKSGDLEGVSPDTVARALGRKS